MLTVIYNWRCRFTFLPSPYSKMQCWKWIQVDHYCFTGVPFQNSWPAASWVKRLGAGSKNFPTNSRYKFLTEEIIGCQNLNFVPKFHQNEGFWGTNCVLLENILTRRKFANKLKLKGTIQFHHDVTEGYNTIPPRHHWRVQYNSTTTSLLLDTTNNCVWLQRN